MSEVSVEFGKLVLISVLRKTLSRRARVGDSRRFDHVKSRSNKGSSRRARELIVSLKSSVRRESDSVVVFVIARSYQVKITG